MLITKELFYEAISKLPNLGDCWVIGLSGGADSLCLTLLAHEYSKEFGINLNACIVDHKLRPESSTEIVPTIDILKKHRINYKIFVWEHANEITGSVEQRARKARYDFLYQFCREVDAKSLMTAHHLLDQWETFFMRLSRGSSLRGLSSIKQYSRFRDIFLVRPLLQFSPEDIRETLRERFGITDYVNDPSNEQLKFERVRWRESYRKLSENYGLGMPQINRTISRLQTANECLDSFAVKYLDQIFDGSYINVSILRDLHIELKMRVLDKLINQVSPKGDHIVSYSLLKNLAEDLCDRNFTATNLSGLVFRRDKTKNIMVLLENRKQKSL